MSPRNLRNFWLELNVDGRKSKIATGPRARSGGFSLQLSVASHGQTKQRLDLSGFPLQNGKNRVIIQLSRELTTGEEAMSMFNRKHLVILEESRECTCAHGHDYE